MIAYVENNPVRAAMVRCAEDFAWSSARAHLGKANCWDGPDRDWWDRRWSGEAWREVLRRTAESAAELRAIRDATYTGRRLGSKDFMAGLEAKLGRRPGPVAGGRILQKVSAMKGQMGLWGE